MVTKMTYVEYVENIIKEYKVGVPVYISEIAQKVADEFNLPLKDASAAVSVVVGRIMNNNNSDLRFFKKGIYYRTKKTPLGETKIDKDLLIANKYLKDDNGYETGLSVLNKMGLTTQMPAERTVATNRATGCIRKDKTLDINVCPPKTLITKENKRYLQTLDAIDNLNKAPIDAEEPYRLIAKYIKRIGLDYAKLLALGGKYYNNNTILSLAQIAGEELK